MKKILLLVLILSATTSFAATDSYHHKKNHKYDHVFEQIHAKHIDTLKDLKGSVKSSGIKQAKALRKSIEQLGKGSAGSAYKTLKSMSGRGLLSDYIIYYKAKALTDLKKHKEALKLIKEDKGPQKKVEWQLYWLRLENFARLNKITELKKDLAYIKKKNPKDTWIKIKSDYYLGLSHFLHKRKNEAYRLFQNILVKYPGTEFDKKIFDLTGHGKVKSNPLLSEANWNLRAEKLIKNGYPQEAQRIWQEFFKTKSNYEERVAYGFFRHRQYKIAAEKYEELLKNGNYKSTKLEILMKLAKSYARHDNFKNAIHYYEMIREKYPNTKSAKLSKFKLAFLYFDSKQYEKAPSYFEPFVTQGTRWQKDRARWFRLWSYYLTKKYDLALTELEALKKIKKKKSDKYGLDYWRARIFDKTGKHGDAKSIYRKLKNINPTGYYGILSSHRLRSKKLVIKTLVAPSVLSHIPKATKDTRVRIKKIPNSNDIQRAALLYNIGLDVDAYYEIKYSPFSQIVPSAKVAQAIKLAGNFNRGFAVRRAALRGSMEGANPETIYSLAYPKAYEKYVKTFSELFKFDSHIAYAVMRQESAFKPEALSYAFAFGLMQIIPPTGAEIAEGLEFSRFETKDLNDPIINTYFGTYYLRYLFNKFKGEFIYTLAAYNAGPDAVSRWIAKADDLEKDEFIELIPYMETNNYVKKVLVNYLVYNRLYK